MPPLQKTITMINILIHCKEDSKILDNFQKNWKRETYTSTDDEGYEVELTKGIRQSVTGVPVRTVTITSGAEKVQLVDTRKEDSPLFTLEGPKALQLTVLEDYLVGLLKRGKSHGNRDFR
jgi:hypothetical protein